jgi:hypothetical protein
MAHDADGRGLETRRTGSLVAVSVGGGRIKVYDAFSGETRGELSARTLSAARFERKLLAATDTPRPGVERKLAPQPPWKRSPIPVSRRTSQKLAKRAQVQRSRGVTGRVQARPNTSKAPTMTLHATDSLLRPLGRERAKVIKTMASSPKHVASRLDRTRASKDVQQAAIEEHRRTLADTAQAVRRQLVDGEKLFAAGEVVKAAAAFTRAQEVSKSPNGAAVSLPIRHRLETRVQQSRLLSGAFVGGSSLQRRGAVLAWQDVDPEMDDSTVLALIVTEMGEAAGCGATCTNTTVVATSEMVAD